MTSEELKNIAPNLHELKALGSGFDVPSDYFNSVEENVFNTLKTRELNKGNAFSTPQNYFENIEDQVFEKIKRKEETLSIPEGYFDTIEDNVFAKLKEEPKVIPLKTKIIKRFIPIVAAASILLFFTMQVLNNNTSNTDLLASLEVDEIENWIENGDLELDLDEITTLYTDELSTIEINDFSDENLINYLDDIDVESLIETE